MPAPNGRLKLAIQKDGRITEESHLLLRAMGFDFEFRSRSLFTPCRNFPLDLLSVRDDDIPEYVQDGVSDLGVVGENIVAERNAAVTILERLGFGKCTLVFCAPKDGSVRTLEHLAGKRIATSYPGIVRRYLARHALAADIIEISGSVEITPALNVADATCDIVSTGSTARVNGLEVIHTVMTSEVVLVANENSLAHEKRETIDRFVRRLRSCLSARGKKYVMMNAPAASVEKIKTLIPGMKSPTIMPLADPNLVAVHSVVGEDVLWEVLEQLHETGASDIVILPIEKLIP
jgi:ATP phosphoribosyltransferase